MSRLQFARPHNFVDASDFFCVTGVTLQKQSACALTFPGMLLIVD